MQSNSVKHMLLVSLAKAQFLKSQSSEDKVFKHVASDSPLYSWKLCLGFACGGSICIHQCLCLRDQNRQLLWPPSSARWCIWFYISLWHLLSYPLGRYCAGLRIYVVYITHYSLDMITRSCSTLYSQWQYLIYTILCCTYSGNVWSSPKLTA